MRQIILIAHNIRSTHNVGSLLRTADGFGLQQVFLTGYSPYPSEPNDVRLPYIAQKLHKQIEKTALGAQEYVKWQHDDDIFAVIEQLKKEGFLIAALEQAANSIKLEHYKPPEKIALIVGREVEGVESEVLEQVDKVLEITMFGKKESFNVAQAAAAALFHLRFA